MTHSVAHKARFQLRWQSMSLVALFIALVTLPSSLAFGDVNRCGPNISLPSVSLPLGGEFCAASEKTYWNTGQAQTLFDLTENTTTDGKVSTTTKQILVNSWVTCNCFAGTPSNPTCVGYTLIPGNQLAAPSGNRPSACQPFLSRSSATTFSSINETDYSINASKDRSTPECTALTQCTTQTGTVTISGATREVHSDAKGNQFVKIGNEFYPLLKNGEQAKTDAANPTVSNQNLGTAGFTEPATNDPKNSNSSPEQALAKLKQTEADIQKAKEDSVVVARATDRDGKTLTEVTRKDARARTDRRLNEEEQTKADVEGCSTGGKFNASYGSDCKNTNRLVETSQVMNQVMQAGGSMAVSTAGSKAQQNAQQSGTYSAAIEGAGSTQTLGGYTQVVTGGVNLMLGQRQGKRKKRHDGNSEQLGQAINENNVSWSGTAPKSKIVGSGVAADYVKNDRHIRNYESTGIADADKESLDSSNQIVSKAAKRAREEQEAVRSKASGSSLLSYITGGQQLLMGIQNIQQGKAAKKLAQRMQNQANNSGIGIAIPGDQGPPVPTDLGGPPGSSQSNSDEVAEVPNQDSLDSLGDAPPEVSDTNPFANAPVAGKFNTAGGNPSGGGGGGGGMGGAQTQAARGEDDGGARPVESRSDRDTRFSDGGGSAFSAGGGGGGGGDQGPDLSGMLAALLPKEVEPEGPGHNIMEFRMPASERDANTPLIPQDYSIFKHISETYGRLHKEKRVVGQGG